MLLFNLILIAVVIFDQFTKYLVQNMMQEGSSITVIDGLFHLTYIFNRGAAFGMLEDQQWLFIFVAAVLVAAVAYLQKEIKTADKFTKYGVAILTGGAIGNLIDRIRINKVVDFLDFLIWPIFNVADIAICVGVGMLLWTTIKSSVTKN